MSLKTKVKIILLMLYHLNEVGLNYIKHGNNTFGSLLPFTSHFMLLSISIGYDLLVSL